MTDDPFTREEFRATAEPMQRDISEIKEAVRPIPAILSQVERTNNTVADHTVEISTLKQWMWMLRGGGIVVAFIMGAGGITYILTEVL